MKTVEREEFQKNVVPWLDLARRGETIEVVEAGFPKVTLMTDSVLIDDEAEELIQRFAERRTRLQQVSQEEIESWVDEGRN